MSKQFYTYNMIIGLTETGSARLIKKDDNGIFSIVVDEVKTTDKGIALESFLNNIEMEMEYRNKTEQEKYFTQFSMPILLDIFNELNRIKDIQRENFRNAVKDFVTFEHETAEIYPWAKSPEEIMSRIDSLYIKCDGDTETEVIYDAIDDLCGVNPVLIKE